MGGGSVLRLGRAIRLGPSRGLAARGALVGSDGGWCRSSRDRPDGVSSPLGLRLDLTLCLVGDGLERRVHLGLGDPGLQGDRISSVTLRSRSCAMMSSCARNSSVNRTASGRSWLVGTEPRDDGIISLMASTSSILVRPANTRVRSPDECRTGSMRAVLMLALLASIASNLPTSICRMGRRTRGV